MAPLPSEGNKALLLNLTLMPDGLTDQQVEIIERVSGVGGAYLARQLLVPEKMKLHSLHYAIQAAFGWLNQFPHYFALMDQDFMRVTNGSFADWRDLVGTFFRAPDAPQESYYPSDTPPANQTFKFWLRNRYRGPYEWDAGTFFEHLVSAKLYLDSVLEPEEEEEPQEEEFEEDVLFGSGGFLEGEMGEAFAAEPGQVYEAQAGETFGGETGMIPGEAMSGVQLEISSLQSTPPLKPDYASMSVEEGQGLFHDDLKILLERIPVGQLLVPFDLPKATTREIDRKIGRADAAFAVGQHITYPITVEMSEYAGEYTEGHTPLDVLELQDRYERVLAETDTAALPIATLLDYYYGPEQTWHVRIECEEVYEMQGYEPGTLATEDFYPILDQTEREIPDEAYPAVSEVILENRPICTAVAGPNVMDNVDGLAGFSTFLNDMFGRQPQARLEANRRARELGWSRHAPDASQVL